MADQQQLDLLKQGVDLWNKWRREHADIQPDLSGANLSDADLSDADLSEVKLRKASWIVTDLSVKNIIRARHFSKSFMLDAGLSEEDIFKMPFLWSDLEGVDLEKANLGKANLCGAFLMGTKLMGANLRKANLSGAFLMGADLSGTNLRKANLEGTNLSGVKLEGADLSGSNLSRVNLSQANLIRADLIGTDLSRANLVEADLSEADLRGANFQKTNLRGANLSEANFREANLNGADLSEADLFGAYLSWADLSKANLRSASLYGAYLRMADLQDANLSGADLSRTNFTWTDIRARDFSEGASSGGEERTVSLPLMGANLRGANLRGANLSGADLSMANLSGANLREANLSWANLSGADLSEADLTRCSIYATSVWDVKLIDTKQSNLVITNPDRSNEPVITVDNLEVAQFIYLLLNNERIRDIINTITLKVVLILGRFTPRRKKILNALRDELRKQDYLPVVFDFDKPTNRDLTETISTLAHMSRFVIADLTQAKSIPQELERIVPDLPSVPVQPLLQARAKEYSMFEHFRRYPWVLKTYHYLTVGQLLTSLKEQIIIPAEQKAKELEKQ